MEIFRFIFAFRTRIYGPLIYGQFSVYARCDKFKFSFLSFGNLTNTHYLILIANISDVKTIHRFSVAKLRCERQTNDECFEGPCLLQTTGMSGAECKNRPTYYRGFFVLKVLDLSPAGPPPTYCELTHPNECRKNTALIRRAGQQLDDQGVVGGRGIAKPMMNARIIVKLSRNHQVIACSTTIRQRESKKLSKIIDASFARSFLSTGTANRMLLENDTVAPMLLENRSLGERHRSSGVVGEPFSLFFFSLRKAREYTGPRRLLLSLHLAFSFNDDFPTDASRIARNRQIARG